MFPLLLNPITAAAVATAAASALAAVYLLRNRFRRRPVSSLMLWRDTREARDGGTRVRKPYLPLLFFLELLALALLCFAAAEPYVRMRQGARPLVVVLDDSFSMTAGGKDSPRQRALDSLAKELRDRPPYSVRFVLAGDRPQLLGDVARTRDEALAIADGWRCRSSSARIDEAIALGGELGGHVAPPLVLVLSDHPPPAALPENGRVRWWSFGRPLGNVALVNAARTNRDGLDRCLLEVANLSDGPRTVRLKVESAEGKPLRDDRITLKADGTERLLLQLAPGAGPIRARIDDDEMALDNEVVLHPQRSRPVRYDLNVFNRIVRDPLEKAIKATNSAQRVDEGYDLLFTDKTRRDAPANAWVVHLLSERDATAYTGPFVTDRSHPLTEGLGLQGLIWGAGKSESLDGSPVVMAGNVPLLSDEEQPTEGGGTRHVVRLRCNPALSTLHESPDWPIFVWNVINWRASAMPGPSRTNARLGEQVVINLPGYRDTVELSSPGESPRTVPVKGRRLALRADEVGTREVTVEKVTYSFAVNALSRDESDLRRCDTEQKGGWLDETTLRLEFSPVAWMLLLIVLGLLTLHLWLSGKAGGGRQ